MDVIDFVPKLLSKEISLNDVPVDSCVVLGDRVCLKMETGEDNLICTDLQGKLLWVGSDLYKKNTVAQSIASVGNDLIKVVWGNNDVKVLNVKLGSVIG